MTTAEAAQLLREIDESAIRAQWEKRDIEEPAKSFEAKVDDWDLLVVSYMHSPDGSRAYVGTATRGLRDEGDVIVMRLTRELAEKFYKAAEGQQQP